MKVHRNSKGFTLIELLIVIAIIGILAAIAIPAYSNYTKRAKMGEIVHAMGAIKNAIAVYYSETGGTKDAANAAAIGTTYGVEVPTGKATYSYTASTRTIAADPLDTIALGTITLIADDETYKIWKWGKTGEMKDEYLPKN